jgi:hypothetical protein
MISGGKKSPETRARRTPKSNKIFDQNNLLSAKERNLINLAIKNSLVEQQSVENYGEAEEMPVFRPTVE